MCILPHKDWWQIKKDHEAYRIIIQRMPLWFWAEGHLL